VAPLPPKPSSTHHRCWTPPALVLVIQPLKRSSGELLLLVALLACDVRHHSTGNSTVPCAAEQVLPKLAAAHAPPRRRPPALAGHRHLLASWWGVAGCTARRRCRRGSSPGTCSTRVATAAGDDGVGERVGQERGGLTVARRGSMQAVPHLLHNVSLAKDSIHPSKQIESALYKPG